MTSQIEQAARFRNLHGPNNPVVLYNIWAPCRRWAPDSGFHQRSDRYDPDPAM